ncbi:RING-H2 finger protein ATL16-like [Vigna unguiculata]|uniref:RING-H2 finger protein ATL16-like n=1 Tax=Vigna unguiculata TaxID=3917 RepID=UPI0010170DCF|nr:RING-H2 finger protein ATL16-like [Vigna unguiculata]
MDFVSQRHLLHIHTQADSPCTVPPNHDIPHHSGSNLPLLAILVVGMLFTTFFLIGYYMLVIKCCFNWPHVNHTRLFSLTRQGEEDPSAGFSAASEPRGLEEAVIRLIPVIHYKGDTNFGERSNIDDCAVCLSEFQQDEKLRVIPNCSHVFHIDCIDVWLQNNTHCPLCRTIVSLTTQLNLLSPRPSTQDQSQNIENHVGDEGFVVIDLDGEGDRGQNLQRIRQELPTIISVSSAKKLHKVSSLGDECIGIRAKGESFSSVQAMRRSFSMDSSVDGKFYGAIQQVLQQHQQHEHEHEHELFHEINTVEACDGSGRVKRSFFSFGHGSRSRSAVQPLYLDP